MSLIDTIAQTLGSGALNQMSSNLGASPDATRDAISAALPVLLGAMQRNASSPAGAEQLHQAVMRDHVDADPLGRLLGMAGGMLGGGQNAAGGAGGGLLGGLLGGQGGGLMGALGGMLGGAQAPAATSRATDGSAILGHILGDRQSQAANGIGKAAGLSAAQASQLMAMLAPMVMAALGQVTQNKQLDSGGLASVLGQESSRIGAAAGQGGLLSSLLDADGDGDVDAADLLKHGAGIFGSFLR